MIQDICLCLICCLLLAILEQLHLIKALMVPCGAQLAALWRSSDGINGFSLAMNEKLLYVKEKVEELKHLVRDLGVKLDILTDPRITPLTPRGGSLLVNSMPHGHAPSHLVW